MTSPNEKRVEGGKGDELCNSFSFDLITKSEHIRRVKKIFVYLPLILEAGW